MKIRAMDFVRHEVGDLDRAVAFYRDVLGLKLTLFSPEWQWAEFDCGNVTLALHGGANPHPGTGGPCLALGVDEIEAFHAHLVACGASVGGPPEDHGVCRHLDVLDPDGNPLILHQRADGTCG